MNNDFHLPKIDQVEQQIKDCEDELAALRRLRRAVKAATRVEELRHRRTCQSDVKGPQEGLPC
jgi:hypothetical protein